MGMSPFVIWIFIREVEYDAKQHHGCPVVRLKHWSGTVLAGRGTCRCHCCRGCSGQPCCGLPQHHCVGQRFALLTASALIARRLAPVRPSGRRVETHAGWQHSGALGTFAGSSALCFQYGVCCCDCCPNREKIGIRVRCADGLHVVLKHY